MPVTINGTSGLTFNDSSTLPSATFSPVYPVTASVAASALTVTLNPCALGFRSSTLTSGTTSTVAVTSAISVTVSSGSTLGTTSAVQSTIMVIAINNGGTVELAVVNLAGGNNLDETTLISTTAEGGAGAADSANVIYSTTARTNVPFRVVGAITSTQATAGTWASAPSTIQGVGGQAYTSLQTPGYSQTWQNVTGSRANGVTYTNSTPRPITIAVSASSSSATGNVYVNGVSVFLSLCRSTYFNFVPIYAVVPPGGTYSITGFDYYSYWTELR